MAARGVKVHDTVQKKIEAAPNFRVQLFDSDGGCFEPDPKMAEKPFEGPLGFRRKLITKGYVQLGSGYYSYVLAKEGSDKVIKITHRQDNWIEYVHWASQEGYAGTYAPRVFSYKKFNAKRPFEVSIVERMDKTLMEVSRTEDIRVSYKLAEMASDGNAFAMKLADDISPGIGTFAMKLKERYKSLDTHGYNVMLRKDGSICWTDPITNGRPVTFTRLRSKDFTLH